MRTGWERQFRSQPNITCLKNLCKMRLIGANGFIRTLLAIITISASPILCIEI